MNSIKLSDGTIIENAECLYDDVHLYIYISGMSLVEGVTVLSDPEKNRQITAMKGETILRVYEGYTELYAASMEFGNCNLILKKG